MKKISEHTASKIVRVIDRTIILLVIIMIYGIHIDVKDLKESIKKKQLAVNCEFLDPASKHSAIVYDRFKSEIRVECQVAKKNDDS